MDLLAQACTESLFSDLKTESNDDSRVGRLDSYSNDIQDIQPSFSRSMSMSRDDANFRYASRGSWTAEEDEKLRKAVAEFGGRNWKKIAEQIPDRTDVQCLHRWQKVLRPGLVKGPWTPEVSHRLRHSNSSHNIYSIGGSTCDRISREIWCKELVIHRSSTQGKTG